MRVFKGTIIVADEANTVAKYLVEKEGRIAYIGDTLPENYAGAEVYDLGSGALLPAFADTYCHYSAFSLNRLALSIENLLDSTEILEAIRAFAKESKNPYVIVIGARPYSDLSRSQLDSVCKDKPVCVFRRDFHSCVVNSMFIHQIKEKAKNMRGFSEDTGVMSQKVYNIVNETLARSFNARRAMEAMNNAADFMAEKGIGLFQSSSGMGYVRDLNMDMERSAAVGFDTGLQMRVAFQTESVERAIKKGVKRVAFGALDGSFGALDAALTLPYEGTDDKGTLNYTDEEVIEFCKKANRGGLQISIHALGDAAFLQAAKALAAALEDYPRYDHRHMIVHACLPSQEAMDICSKYHIMISVMPTFIRQDAPTKEYMERILGTERIKDLNPVATYLKKGIKVCISSDAPASEPDPIRWIHAMVNPVMPSQAVSVFDAIRMCTYNGYLASFDEREGGTLEIGKRADMVVLDSNPYAISADKLDTMSVKALFLNGRIYQHSNSTPMTTLIRGMFPQ